VAIPIAPKNFEAAILAHNRQFSAMGGKRITSDNEPRVSHDERPADARPKSSRP